jgi:hypothetical protein
MASLLPVGNSSKQPVIILFKQTVVVIEEVVFENCKYLGNSDTFLRGALAAP